MSRTPIYRFANRCFYHGLLGLLAYRRASGAPSEAEATVGTEKVLVLACVALVANVGLLREPYLVRIGDVAGTASIVGAWLISQAFVGCGAMLWRLRVWLISPRRVSWRSCAGGGWAATRVAVTAAGLVATSWSVAEVRNLTGADFSISLARAGTVLGQAYNTLSISPPIDSWAPVGSLGFTGLTRYIYECTKSTDRVFVSGFFPRVYFYSGRGFAGGHVDFRPGYHSSMRHQRSAIRRLERQSVPIILMRSDLATYAPFLDAFLRQRYRVVSEVVPDPGSGLRPWVDRRHTPTGVYLPLNAPCYS